MNDVMVTYQFSITFFMVRSESHHFHRIITQNLWELTICKQNVEFEMCYLFMSRVALSKLFYNDLYEYDKYMQIHVGCDSRRLTTLQNRQSEIVLSAQY